MLLVQSLDPRSEITLATIDRFDRNRRALPHRQIYFRILPVTMIRSDTQPGLIYCDYYGLAGQRRRQQEAAMISIEANEKLLLVLCASERTGPGRSEQIRALASD